MVGNCALIFSFGGGGFLPALNFHLQNYGLRCFSFAQIQWAPNPSEFAPTCTRAPKRPKQTCTNSRPEALVCKLRTGTNLHTNSHPLVEDTPAEDLLAAGGANSGRFVRSFEKGLADRGGWREETLQTPEI